MGDPWDFLSSFAHGEAPLPCHMRINWSRPDAQRQASTAALCRGALTMLRNECYLPRDAALAEVARAVETDRITVFANRNEFMQHHFNEHLIAAMREDRMRKARPR
jgi:hypothetical protein